MDPASPAWVILVTFWGVWGTNPLGVGWTLLSFPESLPQMVHSPEAHFLVVWLPFSGVGAISQEPVDFHSTLPPFTNVLSYDCLPHTVSLGRLLPGVCLLLSSLFWL